MRRLYIFVTTALLTLASASMVVYAKTGVSASNNTITREAALNVAYTYAGVSASDVTNVKVELDDGVYEIEFETTKNEYEFEVSRDGRVLESDIDVKYRSRRD